MDDANHDHGFRKDSVVDRVRKVRQEGPTESPTYQRKGLWSSLNASQGLIHGRKEVSGGAGRSLAIPL